MPVARYLLFVGGMLLALLFALDAFAPQQMVVAGNTAPSINKTVVRIRSDQKLPERVVYDTSLTTIVPPAAATQIAAAPATDVGAQAQVTARRGRAKTLEQIQVRVLGALSIGVPRVGRRRRRFGARLFGRRSP